MAINTDPNLHPVVNKPCPLPLKHHKFVKEEIKNLLEVGLIGRSLSPYAAHIIVVLGKNKPGAPLAETKRLVIDYFELNNQIPKVQTTQANSKGCLILIITTKIDHIWSKLKNKNISPYLTFIQDTMVLLYTQIQDQKLHSLVHTENSNGKE